MAMCEKCGKNGFQPEAMYINKTERQFVGPCCAKPQDLNYVPVAFQGPKVVNLPLGKSEGFEYGMKVSNTGGVQAYVSYGGLEVRFDRSADEVRSWAESQGLVAKRNAG